MEIRHVLEGVEEGGEEDVGDGVLVMILERRVEQSA